MSPSTLKQMVAPGTCLYSISLNLTIRFCRVRFASTARAITFCVWMLSSGSWSGTFHPLEYPEVFFLTADVSTSFQPSGAEST